MPCSPPAVAVCHNRPIACIAFSNLQRLLTAPCILIPHGDFRLTLTVKINNNLFCVNRALWTLLPEPNQAPLHREIVFHALFTLELQHVLVWVKVVRFLALVGTDIICAHNYTSSAKPCYNCFP